MKKEHIVYFISEKETNLFYVGSTSHFENRIRRHYNELENKIHHNVNLQKRWDNGKKFQIVKMYFSTIEKARKFELKVINNYKNSPLLLNISLGTNGGDNLSRNPLKNDIIARMKINLNKTHLRSTPEERKLKYGQSGKLNGMYGKTHTPEVRKILSEAHKNRVYRRGFKLSEHQKRLLSEKAKLRTGNKNSFYGKTHTKETKEKIRLANIKTHSDPNYVNPVARRVTANGKTYKSIASAARDLKVSNELIRYRIKNKKEIYSSYKYID